MSDSKQQTITYASTVDGTAPLLADVCYPETGQPKPLLLVMHGYGGNRRSVCPDLLELANRGIFAVAPDMRGRGDSAGRWDSGGLNVHDAVDAARAAIAHFPAEIDAGNLNIVGYSGGGANAISAGCRFPDLFNVAVSFFGIADYARWYASGAAVECNRIMEQVLGPPEGEPARYAARDMVRAAANARATRWYLFWDAEEKTCPPEACDEPWISAYLAAGGRWLHRLVSRPGDAVRWLHGYRTDHPMLARGDDLYLPDVMRPPAGLELPPHGELVVPGYLVTRHFTVFVGDGTQGWARIRYQLGGQPQVQVLQSFPETAPVHVSTIQRGQSRRPATDS